jgi:hypothetical protein
MEFELIQFTGLKELESLDQERVKDLAATYYDKIKRSLKNITTLQIHIKEYKKEGARKKYSVHIKAVAPTKVIVSTKAHDWDIARVMHKAFQDIEREIVHKLKTDDQHNKPYS